MIDYYEILKTQHDASDEQIKKAYRQRARETHPDKAELNKLTKKDAEEKFKKVQQAYETLSDPVKRARYDLGNLPSFNYRSDEFKKYKATPVHDPVKQELIKEIQALFGPSNLKNLVKDAEIVDAVSTIIYLSNGMKPLTTHEREEILRIFKTTGIPAEKISFREPYKSEFVETDARIEIELRQSQLLEILKNKENLNRFSQQPEFKKSEQPNATYDREKKDSDKENSNFTSWSSMFPDKKKEGGELAKLAKFYKLKDTSQPELEKGLRRAAASNNVEDLKKFIDAQVNVNAQDSKLKKTALHWAVEKNAPACVFILQVSGADDTIKDAFGKRPGDFPEIDPQIGLLFKPTADDCLVM